MKKLITILMASVMMLCFAISTYAVELGIYAIPKDKFSIKNPFMFNHMVRYSGQSADTYRFFSVKASKNDEKYLKYHNYDYFNIPMDYYGTPVQLVNGTWSKINSVSLDTATISIFYDITLAGENAFETGVFTISPKYEFGYYLSANKFSQYADKFTDCKPEELNKNSALLDGINANAPYTNWDKPIVGTGVLPYQSNII